MILTVIKKECLTINHLNFLIFLFKKKNIKIHEIYLISIINNEKKIMNLKNIKNIKKINFKKFNVNTTVFAIIADYKDINPRSFKDTWRKFFCKTWGAIHSSDNNKEGDKEIKKILNNKNKLLYIEDNVQRNKMSIYKKNAT